MTGRGLRGLRCENDMKRSLCLAHEGSEDADHLTFHGRRGDLIDRDVAYPGG